MKNPISLGNFSCLYEKALDIVHHRTVLLIGAFGEKYLCDSFSILFHVNHMNMYLDDRTMWKKIYMVLLRAVLYLGNIERYIQI